MVLFVETFSVPEIPLLSGEVSAQKLLRIYLKTYSVVCSSGISVTAPLNVSYVIQFNLTKNYFLNQKLEEDDDNGRK